MERGQLWALTTSSRITSRSSPTRHGRARRFGTSSTCGREWLSWRTTPTRRPTCGGSTSGSAGGRGTPTRTSRVVSMRSWVRWVPGTGHGGAFVYRSAETDVLGWVCERAAGLRMADLISTLVWQPMGAERDAEIICDGSGTAVHDGGLCATARDLARFGQLLLDGGAVPGETARSRSCRPAGSGARGRSTQTRARRFSRRPPSSRSRAAGIATSSGSGPASRATCCSASGSTAS